MIPPNKDKAPNTNPPMGIAVFCMGIVVFELSDVIELFGISLKSENSS